jgi:hypothetical protein
MRRSPQGRILQRYVHLLVLAGAVISLLVLVPLGRRLLERQFADVRSEVTASLTQQLGRSFSYERLSPSVFKNLEIYGLEIDGPRGETLRIDRALASYSILAILTGDVQNVVDRLIIRQAFLEIDFTRDREFLENVRETLFGRGLFPKDLTISLREVEIRLIQETGTLAMTNIGGEVQLQDPDIFADLQSRVVLESAGETPLQLESQVAAQMSTARGFEELTGEVALGRLFGTHAVVDPVAFDVNKSGTAWTITKQQDAQPLDLRVDVVGETTTISVQVDRFIPSDTIAPGPPLQEAAPWLDTRVTGTAEVDIREGGVSAYRADLEAQLPAGAVPEPLTASILAAGDQESLDVERLRLLDRRGGVALFDGTLDIDRLVTAGSLSFRAFSYAGSPRLSGGVSLYPSGGRQGLAAGALSLDDNTVYELSGSVDLDNLLANGEVPAGFELALSLNPERTGVVRASGALGGDGVVSLDAQVEQVSLDELLDAMSAYDPRIGEYARSIPDGRYRLDTRLRLRQSEEGLYVRAPFLSLYDTEDFDTYLSLNLTYDDGTLLLEDILGGTAGYESSGSLFARVASGGTVDFELDLNVEGIEYELRGLYTPGDSFVFSGGHGVDGRVYQSRNGEILFALRGINIPIPLQAGTGSLTFRLDGIYASSREWEVRLREVRLDGTRFLLTRSTGRLELSGTADSTGITLSSIEYNDPVSQLTGKGSVKWQSLMPPTVALNARLESTQGEERYELSGRYEEREISSTVTAARVPFPRLGVDGLRGGVDLSLRLQGNLGNPRVSFNFQSNEAGLAREELNFTGTGAYAEEALRVRELSLEYSTYVLNVSEALLDREAGQGNLEFTLQNNAMERERTLAGSLQLEYELPEFTEEPLLEVVEANGTLAMDGFQPLEAGDQGARELSLSYGQNTLRLSGWYQNAFLLAFNRESGSFAGYARDPLAVQAAYEGTLSDGTIAVTVTEIDVSVRSLLERLPSPPTFLDSGEVTGSMRVVGALGDPNFFGTLRLRDVRLTINPVGETIGPFDTSLILDEKNFRSTRTTVPVGSGEATVELQLLLNRLSLEGYRIAVAVPQGEPIPVDGRIGPVLAEGFAAGNLNISGDTVGAALEGRITAQSVRLAVTPAEQRPEGQDNRDRPNLSVNLEIISGRGVQFVWPNTEFPVLRSNLATQQEVAINANRQADTFSLEGDVEMQSGDVFYFDRNFYIREGAINFDEDQDSFDPRVSLRAELREATPEGPVRIYLVADSDPLSEFSPRFESSPPLSSAEIVAILGGNIFAQTDEGQVDLSSALLSTSDILTQFGVVREFEDNVREALNLDLFSIRTQIFQNIVASAIEEGQTVPEEQNVANQEAFPSLGSYLNNTSVFMGRYLGDELFLEMLVQLQADPAQNVPGRREDDIQSLGGVLIDPEIRLEWQTPFFLLEWNFAPKNPEELFIRDNVFTFSWGFSY